MITWTSRQTRTIQGRVGTCMELRRRGGTWLAWVFSPQQRKYRSCCTLPRTVATPGARPLDQFSVCKFGRLATHHRMLVLFVQEEVFQPPRFVVLRRRRGELWLQRLAQVLRCVHVLSALPNFGGFLTG